MKKRSSLKMMNWQDVTMKQLKSHWDMGIDELPKPLDFTIAAYMNAYAYGDIAGEGIDVRCEYADEAVDAFKTHITSAEIQEKLDNKIWSTTIHDFHKLEMHKGNDIVIFTICDNDEVGYMEMYVEDDSKCSNNIEEYYEQAEEIVNLFNKKIIVSEQNIIDLFQRVCRENFYNTEDAGAGMRNVFVNNNTLIQVYPYNEYHNVFVLVYYENSNDGEHTDYSIKDFDFKQQVKYLKLYYNTLAKNNKNIVDEIKSDMKKLLDTNSIDKQKLEQDFIKYCEDKGGYCYRNEYQGHNDKEKEIIYCTKLGLVYQYFDNNGNGMPTIQCISYPMPSKLLDDGIIHYLIDECLNAGMTEQIKDIANFLELTDKEKDEIGVPHEYFYGWVWENGNWDGKAKYDDISRNFDLVNKDCEYLKSIYGMIKDGQHIDIYGIPFADATTEEMVGNAEQFCTYFKESGLKLQEFLAQYDDLSREDSLWSKCNEFADYLVKNYIADECNDTANELADLMHSFIVMNANSSYFPKKSVKNS